MSIYSKFVREEVAPVLREAGFTSSGGMFRRDGDGAWQLITLDRPKWLQPLTVGFYINAHIVLPRIQDYLRAEMQLPLIASPDLGTSVLQRTFGDSTDPDEGGLELWSLSPDENQNQQAAIAIRRQLRDDVIPWLDTYGSEVAIRDLWLSQKPYESNLGVVVDWLVVILEAHHMEPELLEARKAQRRR